MNNRVPDWQPRILLGIVDARSVNVKNTHTHTHMTRPDCAVMCNLINTHTHTYTHASGIE